MVEVACGDLGRTEVHPGTSGDGHDHREKAGVHPG